MRSFDRFFAVHTWIYLSRLYHVFFCIIDISCIRYPNVPVCCDGFYQHIWLFVAVTVEMMWALITSIRTQRQWLRNYTVQLQFTLWHGCLFVYIPPPETKRLLPATSAKMDFDLESLVNVEQTYVGNLIATLALSTTSVGSMMTDIKTDMHMVASMG